MTIDRTALRALAQKAREDTAILYETVDLSSITDDDSLLMADGIDALLAALDQSESTVALLARELTPELDSWSRDDLMCGLARMKQGYDARIAELEALRDLTFEQRARLRRLVEAMPSEVRSVLAGACRGSRLPCFCGCHITKLD